VKIIFGEKVPADGAAVIGKKVAQVFYIKFAIRVIKLVAVTCTRNPAFLRDSILGTTYTQSVVADQAVRVFMVAGLSGVATSGHVVLTGLDRLKMQEKAQALAAQYIFAVTLAIQIGQ
jgi:hypothetical protein